MPFSTHYIGTTGRRLFNTDQSSLALFLTDEVADTDIHVLDVVALSDTEAYRLVQTPAIESTSYAQISTDDTAKLYASLGQNKGVYLTQTSYLKNDIVRALPVGENFHRVYYWARTAKSISLVEDLAAGNLTELLNQDDIDDFLVATQLDVETRQTDVIARQADVVVRQDDVIARQALVAADLVLTNADVVLTNADVVSAEDAKNAADLSETNAAASETAATLSETNATTQADSAAVSAVAAQQAATDALLAGTSNPVDLRGIRSIGSTHALEMPARDFALDNHSIRGVFKRPTTDTVLWSNQQRDNVTPLTSAFIKAGGSVVVTGGTATGYTASALNGSVRTQSLSSSKVEVGQTLRIEFDVDVSSTLEKIQLQYWNGSSFVAWATQVIGGFSDGSNSVDVVATVAVNTPEVHFNTLGTSIMVVSNFEATRLAVPMGERLIWQKDGRLKMQFGNFTDWTTFEWVSDAPTSVAVGGYAELVASVNREEEELIFFVNGIHQRDTLDANEYHDISAAGAQSLSTLATWLLFSDGSTHYSGSTVEAFAFDGGAIQALPVAERFSDPTLWFDVLSTSEIIGQWDWSVGLDGWVEASVVALAGQSAGGEADWLKVTPTVAGSSHTVRFNTLDPAKPSGTYMKLKLKVYAPSGQAQNINGVQLRFFNLAGSAGQTLITKVVALDQVTVLELDVVATEEVGRIYVYALKDGSTSYAGDDASHLFVKDVELTTNALDRSVDLRVSGLTKPDRIGSDDGVYITASGVADTDPLTSV